MRSLALVFLSACFVALGGFAFSFTNNPNQALFPLHGAVFLPRANFRSENHYFATLESVRPIIDTAIIDAHKTYLQGWAPSNWLEIYDAQIGECDDQKMAVWATLLAQQWTNGSGLDVAFGPACDYLLASASRILSFYNTLMFTNAGFSEYFDNKTDLPLTRIGPKMYYITMMFHQISQQFDWKNPQMFYQKNFWDSELLEGSFCKLLFQGMYIWTIEQKWNLTINPRILPTFDNSEANSNIFYQKYLQSNVGVDYGDKHSIDPI